MTVLIELLIPILTLSRSICFCFRWLAPVIEGPYYVVDRVFSQLTLATQKDLIMVSTWRLDKSGEPFRTADLSVHIEHANHQTTMAASVLVKYKKDIYVTMTIYDQKGQGPEDEL